MEGSSASFSIVATSRVVVWWMQIGLALVIFNTLQIFQLISGVSIFVFDVLMIRVSVCTGY